MFEGSEFEDLLLPVMKSDFASLFFLYRPLPDPSSFLTATHLNQVWHLLK
jgi:hypothetical protein